MDIKKVFLVAIEVKAYGEDAADFILIMQNVLIEYYKWMQKKPKDSIFVIYEKTFLKLKLCIFK